MKSLNKLFLCFSIVLVAGLTACSSQSGPPVINNLSKASYHLVNQDSSKVNFIQDFKGKYTVLGFVYTHCPFVCHLITANMGSIQRKLGSNPNVQFVEITFDPKRDTPSRLRKYMHQYKLNMSDYSMLTGDSTTIAKVMHDCNIKYYINRRDTTKSGKVQYYFKHTNRIDVLDKKGRVRFQYPGSKVSPSLVKKDLSKIGMKSGQSGKKQGKQTQKTAAAKSSQSKLTPYQERGRNIAEHNGCFNCHTSSSKGKTGPGLKGVYGHMVTLQNGSKVKADSSYIIESLNKPDAKIVAGYSAVMPKYDYLTQNQVKHILAYLKALGNE